MVPDTVNFITFCRFELNWEAERCKDSVGLPLGQREGKRRVKGREEVGGY